MLNSNGDAGKAVAMVDSFASVGVRSFDVTMTDANGKKKCYQPGRRLEELRRTISARLQAATTARMNFIVRPRSPTATLIQLDDLNAEKLVRITPFAFLTLCTSPGNFQAWLAVTDARNDSNVEQRLKRGAGADRGASGAARIAGSRNFKAKYAPTFPLVEIVHTDASNVTTVAELERAGLLAEEHPPCVPPVRSSSRRVQRDRGWPDYQRVLGNAPMRRDGKAPDRSVADFVWCILAIDRRHSVEATATKLCEVSEKAREQMKHGNKRYAYMTAAKAAREAVKHEG